MKSVAITSLKRVANTPVKRLYRLIKDTSIIYQYDCIINMLSGAHEKISTLYFSWALDAI